MSELFLEVPLLLLLPPVLAIFAVGSIVRRAISDRREQERKLFLRQMEILREIDERMTRSEIAMTMMKNLELDVSSLQLSQIGSMT
ncbi:hypothetical protein AB6A40_005125 [Gnathostoma spinigerum]|uniref:Uncharacterized protein n=1 Tax=Gnathostoma spinigerum TaxID=75299 RepID=A0ABD6ELW6_9BILA